MLWEIPPAWRRLEQTVEPKLKEIGHKILLGAPDILHELCPRQPLVLQALVDTHPDTVRVVWVGQDPYPRPEDAMGRAFAVPEGRPVPPSLLNLERELDEDMGQSIDDFTLQHWAEQGFLMLNIHLTTLAGRPLSHASLGWEQVTGKIVQHLAARREGLVFVGLGRHAQRFVRKWTEGFESHHTFVFAPHPSPLSASKGFFGSKIFSRITDALAKEGHRMLWSSMDWETYNGKSNPGI